MLAFDAIKFTFKNFTKLLPYYIAPFLLVTIGTALGFLPLLLQNEVSIILAIIGLVIMLAFFWQYIIKSAGIYSLINGLISAGQLFPFEGVDKNIAERSGKYIKYLLVYALLSCLIVSPAFIVPILIPKNLSIVLYALLAVLFTVFLIWIFIRLTFSLAAFVFNDFDSSIEPIKYSFELTCGKALEIIWQFIVFNIIISIILFAATFIPNFLFDMFLITKNADIASNILYNLLSTLINFAALPALVTMLYRKYNGTFTHSDWSEFEISAHS